MIHDIRPPAERASSGNTAQAGERHGHNHSGGEFSLISKGSQAKVNNSFREMNGTHFQCTASCWTWMATTPCSTSQARLGPMPMGSTTSARSWEILPLTADSTDSYWLLMAITTRSTCPAR